MQKYIFGYGSLMETKSRTRTEPQAVNAYPAIITGYQRGWYNHDPDTAGAQPTFLGATAQSMVLCNGVVFPVTDEQITRYDEREKGYQRETIPVTQVAMLDGRGTLEEDDLVYIYVTNNVIEPSFEYPIVQSYVDICLTGCMEIEGTFQMAKEQQFTEKFFISTAAWSEFWVNDRLYPRRPHIYQSNARDIDRLIQQYLPDLFNKIQIEPALPPGLKAKAEGQSDTSGQQVIVVKGK